MDLAIQPASLDRIREEAIRDLGHYKSQSILKTLKELVALLPAIE